MAYRNIEIDEEVWKFLKKNAEPLEDSPNSVLKRLLLGENNKPDNSPGKTYTARDFPSFPNGTPHALEQILEVIYGVIKLGLSRRQATNITAKKRNITTQAVLDKYCRQLGKRAEDIDRLLKSNNLGELQSILMEKFRSHRDIIRDFFDSLRA